MRSALSLTCKYPRPMPIIPISIGIPAITLSRGGVGANAHAPNESWKNENAHLAIHIALITLLVEAGAVF